MTKPDPDGIRVTGNLMTLEQYSLFMERMGYWLREVGEALGALSIVTGELQRELIKMRELSRALDAESKATPSP